MDKTTLINNIREYIEEYSQYAPVTALVKDLRDEISLLMTESSIISSQESISFPMFNKEVLAKFDTGATTCCLHATNIQASGSKVSFSCEHLSQNTITMPLAGSVSVKTADNGDDTRPVIELDVVVQGQTFTKVRFNLNDRSHMDTKVLIGEELLKRGDFAVSVTAESVEEPAPVEPSIQDTPNPEAAISSEPKLSTGSAPFTYDPATGKCTIEFNIKEVDQTNG